MGVGRGHAFPHPKDDFQDKEPKGLTCVCLNNIIICCLQIILIFGHVMFDLH